MRNSAAFWRLCISESSQQNRHGCKPFEDVVHKIVVDRFLVSAASFGFLGAVDQDGEASITTGIDQHPTSFHFIQGFRNSRDLWPCSNGNLVVLGEPQRKVTSQDMEEVIDAVCESIDYLGES